MNPISLFFLAVALSTDAFAAAICKGSSLHNPRLIEALRTGLIFGVIEAATPVIGWCVGRFVTQFVVSWDHWVAFSLLVLLGLFMIHNGIKEEGEEPRPSQHSIGILVLTAFATSIDAFAVGMGLAFANVNILIAASAIGLATTVMVTLGFMLGRMLGTLVGKRAEVAGGIMLIGVGVTILYQHLSIN